MSKYVCPVEYYPNCRKHDCGFYSTVKFFNSLKELKDYIMESMIEYSIVDIFDIEGKKIGNVNYEFSNHNVVGAILYIHDNPTVRTMDNGKGTLTWEKI